MKQPIPTPSSNEDKEKTSLYIKVNHIKKLKYICFKEDKTRTDIIDQALEDFIAKYEKKNGEISI